MITELPQDWGNRLLEDTNKTLRAAGPRRKERCPHKRLSQTCLWVSRSLQWRCELTVAYCRVRGTGYKSACTVLWKEIAIIFITPTVVWLQVTQQGGNTSTENWIKGLLRVPWWLGGRPSFDPWVGKICWRRKWQPTPVLLPRKSHGRRSLVSMGSQRVGQD